MTINLFWSNKSDALVYSPPERSRCFGVESDGTGNAPDGFISAARACDASLPERVTVDEPDDRQADDRPKHRLVAEKTDEV